MKKILFALSLFLFTTALFAEEVKPLYQLPSKLGGNFSSDIEEDVFLVGSDEGLYKVTNRNTSMPLWKEGRVDQLLPVEFNYNGTQEAGWLMRTEKGIFYTKDLKTFEERDKGLPFLTIKKYENKQKTLTKQIQELKDISVNPLNNKEMVTATKNCVYYTNDGGLNWKNLGSPDKDKTSIKSVAVATLDGQSVVFMAHSILGIAYKYAGLSNAVWNKVSAGFNILPSFTTPDEIADILPVVRTRSDGSCYTEIYMSQSYAPIIYKFNWEKRRAEIIYKGDAPVDCFDGLTIIDNVLLYTKLEGFGSLDLNTLESPGDPVQEEKWHKAFASVPGMINTAWIPATRSGFGKGISLSELWLLYPGTVNTPYADIATGRKSIYISAGKCITQEGIDKFRKIVKDRNMNSIVIDMKDDYGLLRYDTKDPLVLEKGTVSNYAIKDLDHLISEFKKDNNYLIARIVTFKDKNLAKYKGGKYAVWDKRTNAPWKGIKGYEEIKDEAGNVTGKKTLYWDENWVDPYSEEVWEYNIAVAKELIERGFDEIQFDYIRFPTDGNNLYNAQYRWQDPGMDKESALISFLSYARENIDAPIGIDIYGANGWNRSGARTGQDSEMLAEYVDVIGPMFYPSHFEDNFLYYEPVKDRTYRIYYYGSFRNTIMCRNRAIIRPWIQSFYLGGMSWYDRHFYDNSGYVDKQLYGVRDALDRGYMCWNNSGNYGTTPPDVKPEDVFPGTTPEASYEKKPAIGVKQKPLTVDKEVDVSILDSILYPNYDENRPFTPFLQVLP